MDISDRNIVLVGMPGAGKSTVGVLLAKALSRNFMDTDVYIQAREGRRLQEIIDTSGLDDFCRLEEEHILSLNCSKFIIATGGSAIYSKDAMKHLSSSSLIIFLSLPFNILEKRIKDPYSRGVVMSPGSTIMELFEERKPLYEQYADITVDCAGLDHEETVEAVINAIDLFSID